MKTDIPEEDKCEICGKDMYLISIGFEECKSCMEEALKSIAERSTLGHLWEFICHFFNFQFICALGCLVWAVQRLFGVGDYNVKTGMFYTKGILKRPRN
jgi:hypothetical protein